MSKAVFIFKAIDKLFANPQNPGKILRIGKKNVEITNDISYAEGEACKLDTYKPLNAEGKLPVIIEIHGGGFVAGDKKYRRALCMWYAMNTNAFVVSLNYGLGPQYKFPQAQIDIANAMNYIWAHADEWSIDLTRSIVTGDSAGAWGAAQVCAMQDNEYIQNKIGVKANFKVTGALFNCGIYDIQTALKQKVLFNLTESICKDFCGIPTKDIDTYEWLDVIDSKNYVTENWPTSFVVYAEKDFFCGGQGEDLVNKLNENKVYNEVYYSTRFAANHTFQSTWKGKDAVAANQLFLDFANKMFKGEI